MRPRLLALFGVLTLAACVLGCGSSNAPGPNTADPHPVHGKITLADGTLLKGGVITFSPLEVKTGLKLRYDASALVNAKGEYALGFNGDKSGAPAGEYKVTIEPRDYQELPGSNSNKIPAPYREPATTPLASVTVKEGDNTLDFQLK